LSKVEKHGFPLQKKEKRQNNAKLVKNKNWENGYLGKE
jgi:hypothetical protein